MPKIKTHKGATKRFKKTSTGKIVHRKTGQDHFNAREDAKTGTNKRRDVSMHKTSSFISKLITNK